MSPRILLGTSFYIARILDSHGAKRAQHRIVNFHKVKNVINRRATRKKGEMILRDEIVSSSSSSSTE